MRQEMRGFGMQWHQLWTTCKQSAPHTREITTPTPHHSIFLRARCSSWHPTASKHWRHKHCQQMPTNIRTTQSYLYFKQMQSSSRLGKMQALLITNKRESATSRSSLILYPPLPIMQPAWLWWTSRRILKSVDVCRTTVHSLNSEMTNDHTKHYNITRKPSLKVILTTGARQTQNVLLLPINRTLKFSLASTICVHGYCSQCVVSCTPLMTFKNHWPWTNATDKQNMPS